MASETVLPAPFAPKTLPTYSHVQSLLQVSYLAPHVISPRSRSWKTHAASLRQAVKATCSYLGIWCPVVSHGNICLDSPVWTILSVKVDITGGSELCTYVCCHVLPGCIATRGFDFKSCRIDWLVGAERFFRVCSGVQDAVVNRLPIALTNQQLKTKKKCNSHEDATLMPKGGVSMVHFETVLQCMKHLVLTFSSPLLFPLTAS